jgi:membrane protein implicated in regulation of membrane protease activity
MVLPALSDIGWGFIVIAILLFLLEAMSPGFFVAVPATVLAVLGVFALYAPEPATFWRWAPLVALGVGVPATLLTIFSYRRMAPPQPAPTTMSSNALIGQQGIVTRAVKPHSIEGKIRIDTQVWSATAEREIPEGARVRVARVDGVVLNVEPEP